VPTAELCEVIPTEPHADFSLQMQLTWDHNILLRLATCKPPLYVR